MQSLLQLLLLGAVAAVESASAKYIPTRITFDDLVNSNEIGEDDIFWESLREVGLLSVTNIPNFNRNAMIQDLEDCLHRQEEIGAPEFGLGNRSSNQDKNGSVHRRTLATRTLSGTPEGMLVATKSERDADEKMDNSFICDNLQVSSKTFRSAVQSVTEAVAARFGSIESLAINDSDNNKISIQALINQGEHLEHFHSYYSENNKETTIDTETTIEWHTDQGMMLLFTPGQYQDGQTSGGFFIQLKDRSTVEVAFDSSIDELVIMLGDGVNQYINGDTAPALRAVPHSVALPTSQNPRLWYGRMVLPPPTAIHPSGKGSTFQDIRTAMIEGDRDALSLGCATSNISARRLDHPEHTEDHSLDLDCDANTSVLCWMTCMTFEEFDVDVESCTSRSENHKVACATEDGKLWDELGHNPLVSLRCLDTTNPTGTDTDMSSSAPAVFGTVSVLLGIIVTAML